MMKPEYFKLIGKSYGVIKLGNKSKRSGLDINNTLYGYQRDILLVST